MFLHNDIKQFVSENSDAMRNVAMGAYLTVLGIFLLTVF